MECVSCGQPVRSRRADARQCDSPHCAIIVNRARSRAGKAKVPFSTKTGAGAEYIRREYCHYWMTFIRSL